METESKKRNQVGGTIGYEAPEDRAGVEHDEDPAEVERGEAEADSTVPKTAEGATVVGPEERELTSVSPGYGEEGQARLEANEKASRRKAG